MINLSPEVITLIMLGGILLAVLSGYYIGAVVGAIALIVGYLCLSPTTTFEILYMRIYNLAQSYSLLALPMFVFMGLMLERSGIVEDMYSALFLWFGGFRGGLAITTILVGTVMAACVGVIAASVTMLTLVALPSMIKRGYSKSLAAGSCAVGGTLGILIPPSIMLVIYGPMAQISVGKLFMAAFGPGLLLSLLYVSYIAIRCFFQKGIAPVVPVEDRTVPFLKKVRMLVVSLVPPAIIVFSVLGVIFLGIASPTEASAVGAIASTLLVVAHRKYSWHLLKDITLETLRIYAFVAFIGTMSFAFVGIFLSLGCGDVVEHYIMNAPFGRWGAFAVIMFIVFILGFFIDWIGILFIIIPIISPLALALDFNPLWFAMMICINLQMAFNTPPMAPAIFFVKGSAPPELEVTTADIIRGVFPFIGLIIVGIILCVIFPQIILWLPGKMIR